MSGPQGAELGSTGENGQEKRLCGRQKVKLGSKAEPRQSFRRLQTELGTFAVRVEGPFMRGKQT